ncbi:MAG: CpsD/CapB family tyrosine-protein kinase [Roseovarius sp.]
MGAQMDEDLPFDLELTRRVNGARMTPKWGMRDPSEAPVIDAQADAEHELVEEVSQDVARQDALALETGGQDLMLSSRDIFGRDLWNLLPTARFGHGGTPLEMQLWLTGHDRAMLRAFDDLRTQLLRTMHGAGWSRIAVCAPTAGSGASFTALNLALSIARIPDARALLMDLDQRAPDIAGMLGMKAKGDMQRLIAGEIEPHDHLVKPAETLALGLGRGTAQNPCEMLHARRTGEVMDEILDALRPDIAIYDLPPMLEHDDLEAFLPHVDGVLLVADATRTLASQITECERRLEGKTQLMGVILNRTRPARMTARQQRKADRRAA